MRMAGIRYITQCTIIDMNVVIMSWWLINCLKWKYIKIFIFKIGCHLNLWYQKWYRAYFVKHVLNVVVRLKISTGCSWILKALWLWKCGFIALVMIFVSIQDVLSAQSISTAHFLVLHGFLRICLWPSLDVDLPPHTRCFWHSITLLYPYITYLAAYRRSKIVVLQILTYVLESTVLHYIFKRQTN